MKKRIKVSTIVDAVFKEVHVFVHRIGGKIEDDFYFTITYKNFLDFFQILREENQHELRDDYEVVLNAVLKEQKNEKNNSRG